MATCSELHQCEMACYLLVVLDANPLFPRLRNYDGLQSLNQSKRFKIRPVVFSSKMHFTSVITVVATADSYFYSRRQSLVYGCDIKQWLVCDRPIDGCASARHAGHGRSVDTAAAALGR